MGEIKSLNMVAAGKYLSIKKGNQLIVKGIADLILILITVLLDC